MSHTKLLEYRQIVHRGLYEHPWNNLFNIAEQKFGVTRAKLFDGAVIFAGFCLVFGFAAQLINYVIGVVYPAYMTMVTLESTKNKHKQWSSYWIIFACFTLVDCVSGVVIRWYPMYWLTKSVFLIWCYFPGEENGSMIIYNNYFRPVYLKYVHVEPMTEEERKTLKKVMKEIQKMKDTAETSLKSMSFDGPESKTMKSIFGFKLN